MDANFFENRNYPPIGFGNDRGRDQTSTKPKRGPDESDASFENYEAVGNVIIRWARDRSEWPSTIQAFMHELGAYHEIYNPNIKNINIVIPKEYDRFALVQAGDGKDPKTPDMSGGIEPHRQRSNEQYMVLLDDRPGQTQPVGAQFVVRLPPAGQVSESLGRTSQQDSQYNLPPLYTQFLCPNADAPVDGNGNSIDDVRMFAARVADYTMRSCR